MLGTASRMQNLLSTVALNVLTGHCKLSSYSLGDTSGTFGICFS